MGISPMEQRLEKMEADMQHIKCMLSELLDISRMSFQNHSEEKIMSAKEVAEFLKLDQNVIYAKCGDGQIPYFKMGKLYKFKKSEILEWVKKQDASSPFSVDDYVERYLQKNQLKG
jgi:excisionase family DNA binding protein